MNSTFHSLNAGLLQMLLATTSTTTPNSTTDATAVSAYSLKDDYRGAMGFTVATVCVYGLAIVAFIAGHLQKGQVNKDEESQISGYLKRMHMGEPGKVDRSFHVLRLKSQFLACSAMGQRHDRRTSRPPRNLPARGRYDPLPRLRSDSTDYDGEDSDREELGYVGRGRRMSLLGVVSEQEELGYDGVGVVSEQPLPSSNPYSRGRRCSLAGSMPLYPSDEEGLGDADTGGSSPRTPYLSEAHGVPLPSIEEDQQSLPSHNAGIGPLGPGFASLNVSANQRKVSADESQSAFCAATVATDQRKVSTDNQPSSFTGHMSGNQRKLSDDSLSSLRAGTPAGNQRKMSTGSQSSATSQRKGSADSQSSADNQRKVSADSLSRSCRLDLTGNLSVHWGSSSATDVVTEPGVSPYPSPDSLSSSSKQTPEKNTAACTTVSEKSPAAAAAASQRRASTGCRQPSRGGVEANERRVSTGGRRSSPARQHSFRRPPRSVHQPRGSPDRQTLEAMQLYSDILASDQQKASDYQKAYRGVMSMPFSETPDVHEEDPTPDSSGRAIVQQPSRTTTPGQGRSDDDPRC